METKICSKCGIEKSISDFRFSCGRYRGECKKCEKEINAQWRKNNKEKIKQKNQKWRLENENYIKEYNKIYYKSNKYKEIKKKSNKKYILNNIEKIKAQKKLYLEKNKEKLNKYRKIYYINHKDNIKQTNHEYYINHKEEAKIYNLNYRNNNKKKIEQYRLEHRTDNIEYNKKWKRENKDKIKIYHKKDYIRRRNNPILRLQGNLRNMINTSFRRKGLRKSMKLEKICCCSMQELVNHLISTYESNYNEKWNWDFVKNVHIDHIKPLATAKTEEDVIELCHYKNLQLLKAEDNLRKGSLIIEDYL